LYRDTINQLIDAMHVDVKGQVNIPIVKRNNLGRKANVIKSLRNKGDIKVTTDEIMKLTRVQ